MKQKARFKHFGNISYWPTNGRYISIGPKKKHIGWSLTILA